MKKIISRHIGDDRKLAFVLGAIAVFLFSLCERAYTAYGSIFFNKGFCSFLVFLVFYWFIRRALIFVREKKPSGYEKVRLGLCYLFLYLLSFSELAGLLLRLYEDGRPVALTAASVGIMALLSFLTALMLLPLCYGLLSMEAQGSASFPGPDAAKEQRRYFLKLFLFCLISYMPCFLAFFPGIYCYDMSWQWQMVIEQDFFAHHPLIHTVLAGGIFELMKDLTGSYNMGLAVYSLLQLLVIAASAALAGTFLKKWGANRGLRIGAQLFYMLFPFIPIMGLSTTKDVIFGALFLMVMVFICDMALERRVYRGAKLLGFFALLLLMQLFRNNAAYGVLFMALVLFIAGIFLGRKQRKSALELEKTEGRLRVSADGAEAKAGSIHRIAEDKAEEPGRETAVKAIKKEDSLGGNYVLRLSGILLIGGLAAFLGFAGLKTAFSAAEGSKAEMLSIPCQQLARVYKEHGDELSEEERQLLFTFIRKEGLDAYKYYVSDPVKANLDMNAVYGAKRAFLSLWIELGLRYPGTYIAATLSNTMGLWYLGGDSSSYVEYEMSPPLDEEHGFTSDSKLPFLKDIYSWFTDINIKSYLPVISLIFYTSFYAWGTLLCGLGAIFKKRYELLIPVLFSIAYMLSLVPGPCITIRYMFGVILSFPLLLGLCFSKLGDKAKA